MKAKILILIALFIFLGFIDNSFAVECGSTPTDNCDVTQNTTFNTGTYSLSSGIEIEGDYITLDCNNSVLIGNKSGIFSVGIKIWGDHDFNTIKNCQIKNYSGYGGLLLNGYDVGVRAENNKIISNLFEDNTEGMRMGSVAYFTTISDNLFKNNAKGIHFFGAVDTRYTNITRNNFLNNSIGIRINGQNPDVTLITTWLNSFINNSIHVSDDSCSLCNAWNISEQGNYWSSYDSNAEGCFDTNSDFICDEPYNLSGFAGSKDRLPTTGLQILDIIPIQVIKDVDLVKGKTTLLRSLIKNVGIVNRNINVSLYFDGVLKTSTNASINSEQEKNIDLFFIPNTAGSNKEIQITVKEI